PTQYIISLNYAKRDKEDKELEGIKLKRINERYAREGKKPLANLEALPKDYEGPDAYLDETVKIAADLAKVPDISKSAQ
ncbi:carboxy terminal-processing peptidase, partial [Morganella morganii]